MMKTNGIQHVGIPVRDVERTRQFYGRLGFTTAFDTMNGDEHVVFLQNGNLVLEAYQRSQTACKAGAWDHVCLDVADIDEAWAFVVEGLHLPALEGKICFLPFWKNGVRFFTIQGPDGEKIEFGQIL